MAQGLKSGRRIVRDWAATIAVAVVVVLACEAEVAKPYRVPSPSMEPTLHCARPSNGCRAHLNDRVIVDRITYRFREPRRGEVVVFTAPAAAGRLCSGGGTFIKRLVGLPGEVVSERLGRVSIDGRALREPYVAAALRDRETRAWRIPEDRYFFMGDNRAHSCDSRVWGSVPRSAIIGRVVATYWPPRRLHLW